MGVLTLRIECELTERTSAFKPITISVFQGKKVNKLERYNLNHVRRRFRCIQNERGLSPRNAEG